METDIQKFYKNKTIFLTGASGFLGRVVIEKLLRATEVSRIYALMRPKHGKDPKERIDSWRTNPLFEALIKSQPNALDRVTVIDGDCQKSDLGISLANRKLLIDEVQLVVHSAATVNFTEPLNLALDINTRATRLMLQLAKEMTRLQAFVHVSTAFSNCVTCHIKEQFYPEHLNCSADRILAMREQLDDQLIDKMTPVLLDKFPNTYTYTKALAEQLVEKESGDMPVCIFRPGNIVATSKEPICGWIDNLYGPIALVYGVSFGVLRVISLNKESKLQMVPVDNCANLILSSAWQTAKEYTEKSIASPSSKTIYNFVPSGENAMVIKDLEDLLKEKRMKIALNQAIWYPILINIPIYWLFKLATVFYHILPGYVFDLLLRLRGERPRMIKIYDKIHMNIDLIRYFMIRSWNYEMINTDRLWQCMSAEDQELFEFDMKTLNWTAYWDRVILGMRTYLGKEEPTTESLLSAKKKMRRLLILHRFVQVILVLGAAYILRWLINLFL